MRRTSQCLAVVGVLAATVLPSAAGAFTSSAVNWSTRDATVVCGIVGMVHGTALDPGTGGELDGLWPGLQCAAAGIPRPRGVGDPFVQLGQGRAGRARLVDESQDDLLSSAPLVTLRPGSTWKRDHIACALHATSVRCTNSSGHGFAISPGHVHLF
jgi:hypothetical protein